jgi:SAM-dependent methyltransferase
VHLALLPEAQDPVAFWADYYRPFLGFDADGLARLFSSSAVHLAARRQVARAAVQTKAGGSARARVLDAGCGLGVLGLMCRDLPAGLVGIDQAGPLLAAARRLDPDADFRDGGLDALPAEDGSFDLFVALSALECTSLGLGPALAEARRVLRPGGELFAACLRLPLALRPRTRVEHASTLGDLRLERAARPDAGPSGRTVAVYYTGRELARAARRAGFEDVRLERSDALGGLAYAPPLPRTWRARCLEHLGRIGARRVEGAERAPFDRLLAEDPSVSVWWGALGPIRAVFGYWTLLRARRPEAAEMDRRTKIGATRRAEDR